MSLVHSSAYVTNLHSPNFYVAGPRPFQKALRAAPFPEEASSSSCTVKFRVKERKQCMIGFGAAMTESSALVIWGHPNRDAILDDLFKPMAEGGAGISCIRICVGSSDFSLNRFTYQDAPTDSFSAARDDRILVPVLKAALKRNPAITLIASPWSAPAWMKHSGKLDGGEFNMKFKHAYCNYLMRYVLFYERHGLPIHAITLQNEPFFETTYPSMALSVDAQVQLASELVNVFRCNGIHTRVVGHDHNFDLADKAIEFLTKCEAAEGTAWHAYQGNHSCLENDIIQKRSIYFTEQTAHTKRPRNSSLKNDLSWMLDNVLLGPTSKGACCCLEWNLALDEHFGPVLQGGPDNCRGILEVPRQTGSPHDRSPEYYGLAHCNHATATRESGMKCRRVATNVELDKGIVAEGFIFEGDVGTASASLLLQNTLPTGVHVIVESEEHTIAKFWLPGHSLLSASDLTLCDKDLSDSSSKRFRSELPFEFPQKFMLQSPRHRTHLAAHGEHLNCIYQSKSTKPATWETWSAVEVRPRLFALRSHHGTFIGRAKSKLVQTRSLHDAVLFTVFQFSNGHVAFYSDYGCMRMPDDRKDPEIIHCQIASYEAFALV